MNNWWDSEVLQLGPADGLSVKLDVLLVIIGAQFKNKRCSYIYIINRENETQYYNTIKHFLFI